MPTSCSGTNRDGNPCSAQPQPGSPWCLWHDPAREAERASWRRQGGRGKANTARAAKKLPRELVDVKLALLRALANIEDGTLEPQRATAMATLAKAVLAVDERGAIEARIEQLESVVATQKGRTG